MSYLSSAVSIVRPYATHVLYGVGALGCYLFYRGVKCCSSRRKRQMDDYMMKFNFTKKLFDRLPTQVARIPETDKADALKTYKDELFKRVETRLLGSEYLMGTRTYSEPLPGVFSQPIQYIPAEGFQILTQLNVLHRWRDGNYNTLFFPLTCKRLVVQLEEDHPLQVLFTPQKELETLFENIEELLALLEHRLRFFKDVGLDMLFEEAKKKLVEEEAKRSKVKGRSGSYFNSQVLKNNKEVLRILKNEIELMATNLQKTRKLYEFACANKLQAFFLYEVFLGHFENHLRNATDLIRRRELAINLDFGANQFMINLIDKYVPQSLENFKNWYFLLKRIYPHAREACELQNIELPFINIDTLDCAPELKGHLNKFERDFHRKEEARTRRAKLEASFTSGSRTHDRTDDKQGHRAATSASSAAGKSLKKRAAVKSSSQPNLTKAEQIRRTLESEKARKEEIEKAKGKARREDNLKKYRLIQPHQFALKIVPALTSKHRENLYTIFGMNGSYDHKISNADIVALAEEIRTCTVQEFQERLSASLETFTNTYDQFLNEVNRRHHAIHEGHGDKLPSNYVDIRRSTFIRFGMWPAGWTPKNQKEIDDQNIYFDRAIASVFGHEDAEEGMEAGDGKEQG